MLNLTLLDDVYRQYGYEVITRHSGVRIYLYKEGRYFGADVVPIEDTEESKRLSDKLKHSYADSGYAVRVRYYTNSEQAERDLYRSFFSFEDTQRRLENKYSDFVRNQGRLMGSKYEYINAPFQVNNEPVLGTTIVDYIVSLMSGERPQLVIIEAAAGYGKTCTAYEVLRSLVSSETCENPLMTELSRNRGATIFRYVLLDEIDREYPSLDSTLVKHEIETGRIPLIIDGFDEILTKSDMVISHRNEVFEEIETMLDTIGSMLKGRAKIILTTRKTAIFAGAAFNRWVHGWNEAFDTTRISIDVPRVKDWLGREKLSQIQQINFPVEHLANPVLLTYLRGLDPKTFAQHIEESNTIVEKYFFSLMQREIERQDLKIVPEEQYQIFKNVVRILVELDVSSEKRSFLKEIIYDENKSIISKAIKLYPSGTTADIVVDKLATHALLDRKGSGDEMIGFVNDFIFGTFIGEILSEVPSKKIDDDYSAYMVEIGATAYRVQNSENRRHLWQKLSSLRHRIESSVMFNLDITLIGKVMSDYRETVFQSVSIYSVDFTTDHTITSCTFINCRFKYCAFESGVFENVSFVECYFDDCALLDGKFVDEGNDVSIIKCKRSGSEIFSFDVYGNSGEATEASEVQEENEILELLFEIESVHKSQRLMHVLKTFDKTKKARMTRAIDRLANQRLVSVCGQDMFIEMNKINIVKQRINK